MQTNIAPLPFVEAVAWATARKVVLPDVYYGELQGLARAMSFSIAGVASIDTLTEVHKSLIATMETGDSFGEWKKKIKEGVIPLPGLPQHRVENIFRTNIQGHYARGRCEQQRRNVATRPWLLYDAVNDSRTRPAHAAMDGFVARYDDPVWKTWRPPCGYQCRCRVIALSEAQAMQYISADQRRMQEPGMNESRTKAIAGGPDDGWDYDVCTDPSAGVDAAVDRVNKNPLGLHVPPAPVKETFWDSSTIVGQRHEATFKDAPDYIKAAISRTPITWEESAPGCAFAQGTEVHQAALLLESHEQSVWRHECGHALDHNINADKPGDRYWFPNDADNPGDRYWSPVGLREPISKDSLAMLESSGLDQAGRVTEKVDELAKTYKANRLSLVASDRTADEVVDAKASSLGLDPKAFREFVDRNSFIGYDLINGSPQKASFLLGEAQRMNLLTAIELRDAQGVLKALESYAHGEDGWMSTIDNYYNFERGSLAEFSDLLSAITSKKIEGCASHTMDYYQKLSGCRRQVETFANVIATLGSKDHAVWNHILTALLPNTTNAVKSVILK